MTDVWGWLRPILHPHDVLDEPRARLLDADAQLSQSQADNARIDKLARELRRHAEGNHLAERIRRALESGR